MTYPDEHDWLKQYDKPLAPWKMAATWGAILAMGILSIIGLASLVSWFVEKVL